MFADSDLRLTGGTNPVFATILKIGVILSIYKQQQKQIWEYIYHNTSSENQLMWRKSPSL
jgi:hypothetical protein